jgi:hypothetical protein
MASLAECAGGQGDGLRRFDLATDISEERRGSFLTQSMTPGEKGRQTEQSPARGHDVCVAQQSLHPWSAHDHPLSVRLGVRDIAGRLMPAWLAWLAFLIALINLAFVPAMFFGYDAGQFYSAVGWGTTATAPVLVVWWIIIASMIMGQTSRQLMRATFGIQQSPVRPSGWASECCSYGTHLSVLEFEAAGQAAGWTAAGTAALLLLRLLLIIFLRRRRGRRLRGLGLR